MSGKKRILIYIVLISASFLVVVFLIQVTLRQTSILGKAVSQSQNMQFEYLKNQLRKFVDQAIKDGQATQISVYFIDISSNFEIGINEKHKFMLASLLKVPKMIAIFKKAESYPQILNRPILYQNKLSEMKQNILPNEKLELGKIYTVDDLISRMIIFSDNQADNLLTKNIDNDILNRVFIDLGTDISSESANGYMSAKDYSLFFKTLFDAQYLTKQMSEKAIELLTKSAYKEGLEAGLPDNIKVAHKFGERSWDVIFTKQLHDCGIVYYPNHPYLLCIMTRGYDLEKQSTVIRQISGLVYDQVNKEYQ